MGRIRAQGPGTFYLKRSAGLPAAESHSRQQAVLENEVMVQRRQHMQGGQCQQQLGDQAMRQAWRVDGKGLRERAAGTTENDSSSQ
jgi:hypothetical protein